MLYKKNNTPQLDWELFKNPTCEYRATPFWAWNCKLDKNELLRQIECLKQMGFGGFHMHSRAGMATEYLSEEFMNLIKACEKKAEDESMLAYLYDEDRWPSGSAGGYVTKNPANRGKFLKFTCTPIEAFQKEEAIKAGKPYLISCYDIVLNSDGTLKSYDMIDTSLEAKGKKWYVYACTNKPSGWYNNQAYVDTLSNEAMAEFIKITYEAYKNALGDKFGKTVPSIFTDEPQFCFKGAAAFSDDTKDIIMPWTTDFGKTYKETYNEDLIPHLPELKWELEDGKISQSRYRYHDHVCERFTNAFADQCGKWCSENGLNLTGHMLMEESLQLQTMSLGEAMRSYRSFGFPGIDMLSNHIEFSTAKQTQSAVHQYGKEAMTSELYGVTGWKADFRCYKFQGDWQAALGVTIRVPHLSWVSMKGSAKRDYPASINYQSPWYKEYNNIEDYYARINTVLTRGKPIVDVAVIHPIESYWIYYGPKDLTSDIRNEIEENFQQVTNKLLLGTIDFDFISESLLPELYKNSKDNLLNIGKMKYKAVVVPNLITIRNTTLKALEEFSENGGKVIFIGECPKYVDASPSELPRKLYEKSIKVPKASVSLLNILKDEREVLIYNTNGSVTNNLIYSLREDNGIKNLFIAHGVQDQNVDVVKPQNIIIHVKGKYIPVIFDGINGEKKEVDYEISENKTVITYTLYEYDSVLFNLTPAESGYRHTENDNQEKIGLIDFKSKVEYERDEPNVMLLDIAKWSSNGKDYQPYEEILRIDKKIRDEMGFPMADGQDAQPWVIEEEKIENFVYLKFDFESEIEADCRFAFEELCEVSLNGENVPVTIDGWYVDKSVHTIKLPNVKKGRNEIIAKVPIGKRISIENFFVLGEFDVKCEGISKTLIPSSKLINFGSVVPQGLPFYGGNIKYKMKIETPDCDIVLKAARYRGTLMRVIFDGEDKGTIIYSPYEKIIENVKKGKHTVEIILYGNRFNTFGALHDSDLYEPWKGPNMWYKTGDGWSYEYCFGELGILSTPVISIMKK